MFAYLPEIVSSQIINKMYENLKLTAIKLWKHQNRNNADCYPCVKTVIFLSETNLRH